MNEDESGIGNRDGFVVTENALPLESWDESADSLQWRTLLGAPGRETDGITLGVAEVSPGKGGAPRSHSHAHPEAYYVLSGVGIISIAGVETSIAPGSAAYIPGHAPHHARNTGDEMLRILYVFPANAFAEVEYDFGP